MKSISLIIILIAALVAFELSAQQFTKVTDSPLSTTPGDSRSVNWVDVNNDGYVDCFISNGPQAGQNNMLYINDHAGNFAAVTDDPIVKDIMPSDGASFADVDNDGDLDAFVVNWYNRNNLAYFNNGNGTFTQITEGQWVTQGGFSETASFGDYDADGKVDLYVTNSAGTKRNFLHHNTGEGKMEAITVGTHVTDAGSSRNVTWVDMDMDGDSDLFITNENSERNHVYRNDGNGVFTKLNDVAIATSFVSTMSSCWGDTDNDGDLDVVLSNDGSKNQYFRNEGNFVFTPILDSDISLNVANSFSGAFGDIDNDGDLDLFVTNAFKAGIRLKNLLYLNDGTGHFTQVTTETVTQDLGWSYGCAFGDYDNNGYLDLAVATTRFGNVDDPDYLYRNNGGNNHYLMFALEGTTSNRSAIGAIVKVKANINGTDVWQMRDVSAQSGYCGQNDMRLHFGLGDATEVDSVIIEWPSGIVEYMTSVGVDTILQKKESIVSSTSIPEKSFDLILFPNPARSSVTIQAEHLIPASAYTIEIVNDSGTVVYRTQLISSEGKINTNLNFEKQHMVAGSYSLRIFNSFINETRRFIYLPE